MNDQVENEESARCAIPAKQAESKTPERLQAAVPMTSLPPGPDASGPSGRPQVPDGGLTAWLQVLGACVIMVNTFGLVNSFGVFQTYYETVLIPDVSSSDISWIGSLQGALLCMLGIISGPIFDMGYFRELMMTGLFLVIFGQFMTSICTQFWQLILAQGICIGLGCGLLFLPSAAILSQYFAKRRAIALGFQSVGSPLAGICFPIIFSRLEPQIGFGWATRVIAFILLGISVIPLAVMRTRIPPPKHKRAFLDNSALTDVPILLFTAGGFFVFLALYVPFFYVQLYGISFHLVPGSFDSAYLVTLMNAGSAVGRILPNFAADYWGSMNMLTATGFAGAIVVFAWLAIFNFPGVIVFALIYGLLGGGLTSLPPSAIVSLCPDLSRLGTRMGMVFLILGLSILVGTPIAGAILGDSSGWMGLIVFTGVALFVGSVGFLLSLLAHYQKSKFGSGPK